MVECQVCRDQSRRDDQTWQACGRSFVTSWGAIPLLILALLAALIAMATTPLAFAVLGRLEWFKARRGRVMQRPEFSSIVVGMMLVMGIPAIFAALVIKSRWFDHNRYEFDPNKTWSVLDQGREYKTLKEADDAVRLEMERLALERKNLVNNVKKLDEAMLSLRSVAGTSPAVAQRFPAVLQSLAGVRKSVGLDGPQQLLDYTAPPVDLRALAANSQAAASGRGSGTGRCAGSRPRTAAPRQRAQRRPRSKPSWPPCPSRSASSPACLPLSGLPPEWTVGKPGDRHLETFNADNLYEKIDGRAESFIQYGVKGMAYTFYHPTGDPSNELQLYVFEMADSLKALGKYGSEKPEEFQTVADRRRGVYERRQLALLRGPVLHPDRLHQGRPQIRGVRPRSGQASGQPAKAVGVAPGTGCRRPRGRSRRPQAAAADARNRLPRRQAEPKEISPATYFALLPAQGREGDAKYVAQDVFGYSFLSDVFMADYKEKDVAWQGFLRPYRDAQEAKSVLEKYIVGRQERRRRGQDAHGRGSRRDGH